MRVSEGGQQGGTLTYGAQELTRWSERERELKRKVASKRPRPPSRSFVFFSLFFFFPLERYMQEAQRRWGRESGRGVLLKGGTAILSSGFLEMSETN